MGLNYIKGFFFHARQWFWEDEAEIKPIKNDHGGAISPSLSSYCVQDPMSRGLLETYKTEELKFIWNFNMPVSMNFKCEITQLSNLKSVATNG